MKVMIRLANGDDMEVESGVCWRTDDGNGLCWLIIGYQQDSVASTYMTPETMGKLADVLSAMAMDCQLQLDEASK